MAGGFLHVAQRYAGVECCGDERVAECVGSDGLGDARVAGDAGDGSGCGVTIEPHAVETKEEWSFATFTDGEVDSASCSWSERDDDGLASLAQDREGAVSALESERFDVRAGGFGD